jgi:signal transduction histidine kinase
MSEPLRVLIVEDSDDDAELVIRELERGGYEPKFERVQTQQAFKDALDAAPWDVIISDHTLPTYSGFAALADLRATGKDIPFILVSGTIGESVAVAAMKAGAQDYVLKNDLTRLPVAVAREVREAAGRVAQTKMREQLVISERMASAGMLAAGVAHEINNPLAIAVASVDFMVALLARLGTEPSAFDAAGSPSDSAVREPLLELQEPLRDTREALERIRDIVRDVKLFSRSNDEAKGAVDVRRIIDSSSRMAQNEIRHRARLVKRYGDVPLVDGNESRIGQVILNLIVNAAQAIPEGHAERNEIRLTTRTADDGRAVVEVADTGAGIGREILERIFDPFFTTKPVGIGTGLGLAICHRIVSELGGQIAVESEVGKGSLFRVILPAARARPPLATRVSGPPAPSARARVLVVDDEVAVGRALKRSLSAHHDVVAITSGGDALVRIADGELFDVILCDLMMPEVSGMEMHERLRNIAPHQTDRMIFLTGGAFTPAAREFLDNVPNPRIDKPVEITNLLAIIAGLMPRDPFSHR